MYNFSTQLICALYTALFFSKYILGILEIWCSLLNQIKHEKRFIELDKSLVSNMKFI